MKIKSLLLGTAVAMGLTTGAALAADAADLGVLSSLNVCDEQGVSGLILASETNCLKISGEVSFSLETEFDFDDMDFDDGGYAAEAAFEITFDAVNGTDFGPAHAIITIEGSYEYNDDDDAVYFSEAYVSIGDQTVIAAGLKDSISDDLTSEGLTEIFSNETSGLGADGMEVGGVGLSLVHQLGDGFSIGGALEALTDEGDGRTFVGIVTMEQDMFSGHVAFGYNDVFELGDPDPDWEVDSGIGVEVDMFEFIAGIWFDENFSFEAVLSAAVELDMVTLAGELFVAEDSPEYDGQDGFIWTGSAAFEVNDEVEVAIAGVWSPTIAGDPGDSDEPGDEPHGEFGLLGEVTYAPSETWEFVAHGEAWFDTYGAGADPYLEGSIETTWNPDGDDNFEASALFGVTNANGGEIFTEVSVEKAFE
jgi:hypothetical protein